MRVKCRSSRAEVTLVVGQHLLELGLDVAHPEFVPLLNEANLHEGRHVRSSRQARDLTMPLVERIGAILDRGVEDGQMRPGVDPIELYITIAGISYFYFSNHHTLSEIFGRDLMAAESLARRRAHVVSVVLGYLQPEQGGRPAGVKA